MQLYGGAVGLLLLQLALTAGVAGGGLAAAETLAVGWLEERQYVDAGHLVKAVEVYPSAGSS